MEYSQNDDLNNISLTKFESMLKTNDILFFDSNEFENIIHYYLDSGKVALAKKAIKLGLEQHPSSVNLQLFKVEILVIENKFDTADDILDQLHILEPNNEEIYIQKANILSKKDEHEEAIKVLLSSLELISEEEDASDIYALVGMEYLFLDQFENAIIYFQKCLEADLMDYSALHNIVYCFDFLDKNKEAIEFLNHYLDRNPYCEVAWHQLGRQYFAIKEFKKAETAFDFAIISDDTFIGAYLEKGKVLEKQGKCKEAIEQYKITLALDDPTSFALLRIGHCYEKMGHDELAVQFFDKTVEEDPLLDKGWIAITKFYLKKHNYQKALYFINKAIAIDNDNVLYWKLYAQINLRLNFLEEAEHGYQKTLELGNYELDTWLCRADILVQLGEYEAAIINLNQASEFYTDSAEVDFRLAGLHFKTSDSHQGRYHLKNAYKSDPEYDFILLELFPGLEEHPVVCEILEKFKGGSV